MLIDTHCHIDFSEFDEDRDQVVERAHQAGVKMMVAISVRIRDVPGLIAIAERYPSVFCSVGTHPSYAHEETGVTAKELILLSAHSSVVALGETGLDYYHNADTAKEQKRLFLMHIEAARATGLPVVIHSRMADEDMAMILQEEMKKGRFTFILHCFSSSEQLAMSCLKLGGYISFSGILTFDKSEELRSIAAKIPEDRLLVETDAPYLTPQSLRGRRNEPSYVVHTAKVLAEIRKIDYDQLSVITTENAMRVYSCLPKVFIE
ncbi:Putative deoxyribonuclease YcfH [Liberibacter crescens BT-1]|uniref:Putative deoxyribonuclease YcfH n=1 Tax=Liberibacter crescens (strain BT-1) TaxID=1215343 RepID=L0EWN2_LIBCB|nr:TatD family hydrolase [Liberibacter crescens]AGA64791.1 Putative deoxyribonuclease YcfH [Liberibacter crescens BT-1]AMC12856.1 LuxR family transcriptional regulator [Liberibacter crescens]